jgi:dextranase
MSAETEAMLYLQPTRAARRCASPLLVLALLAACSSGGGAPAATATPAPPAQPAVTPPADPGTTAPAPTVTLLVATDKAAYAPGATVRFTVRLHNGGVAAVSGAKLALTVRHLGQEVATLAAAAPPTLAVGDGAPVELAWTAPAADFRGYSVEAVLTDAGGAVIGSDTGAVDVSSSWLKFPRYGYVSGFAPGLDAKAIVEQLKAYHINALQFYDWQWKHHVPLAGTPAAPAAAWEDIARRPTSRATILALIDAAHAGNMAAMQYNLIYGAAVDYQADGVSPAWGLYDTPGGKQWQYSLPSSWTSSALYFFNPLNPDWQKFILDREMDVFAAYPFDGWHGDTVGDNGIKYDAQGKAVDIKDTFKPFLNAAKARLGNKLLVMNAVGNKGHEGVNSSHVDAIYVEVWPWDGTPDYASLKAVVDQGRVESGGKSLMMPAYMNYDYAKTRSASAPGQFNEPGVLLTEATVLAAGGSRLELGDDTRMLCNEYFPNRNLVMSTALKQKVRYYYDFAVAYENLLRDGQADNGKKVTLDGVTTSTDGRKDTVWAYAREDQAYETVNLINLVGVADTSWRDTNATQKKPVTQKALRLRYYTGTKFSQAYAASPDLDGGRSKPLAMETGSDAQGAYVQVVLPALEYWNLVYFRKETVK